METTKTANVINETATVEVVVKSTYDFDDLAKIQYNNFRKNAASCADYPDDYTETEIKQMNQFANYELTNDDKIAILREIVEECGRDFHNIACADVTINGIANWIEKTFGFKFFDIYL